MSYGSLNNSKVSSSTSNGFTRNIGSSILKVGKLAVDSVGALGKSLVGRDDFTQKVAKQAKGKY